MSIHMECKVIHISFNKKGRVINKKEIVYQRERMIHF